MKKSSFLGPANWVVNSLPFALDHLWQVPFTWPLVGLVFAFGLLRRLRKATYVLVSLHFFSNMWLSYGEYPLQGCFTSRGDVDQSLKSPSVELTSLDSLRTRLNRQLP